MASYVKVTYNVTSTSEPTYVAKAAEYEHVVSGWIDYVTIASSAGTVISLSQVTGYNGSWLTYQFPSTGLQDLYFFCTGTSIDKNAFDWRDEIVEIDCLQDNNTITSIGEFCFHACHNLKKASLSNDITSLGQQVFSDCNSLEEVNVPESLTYLNSYMFWNCYSLSGTFVVPDNIQGLYNGTFNGCSGLTELHLGSGLTHLGVAEIGGSSISSITATCLSAVTYSSYNPHMAFKDAVCGGTLYYPVENESVYGPDSGWLSTDEYWLGYYGWNGVPYSSATPGIWLSPDIFNIGSGQSAHSTTAIYTSGGAEYSGFTYTTGGSMAVEVVSGSGRLWYYVPQNDTTSWRIGFTYITLYDTSGNTYQQTITISQRPGTGITKVLEVANSSFDIGSGSSTASTTVNASGCTYSGFSYTTGGSFSVTATSGPNDTIVFSVPDSDVQSAETGFVYLTLYDDEGTQYSQTVEFTQEPSDAVITYSVVLSPSAVTFPNYSGVTTFTATLYRYADGVLVRQSDISQEDDTWSESGDTVVEDRDLNNYEFNNSGASSATVYVIASYNWALGTASDYSTVIVPGVTSGAPITHSVAISPKTVTIPEYSGTTSFTATYYTYQGGQVISQIDISEEDDIWSESGATIVEDRDLNNYEFLNTASTSAVVYVIATYGGVSDYATVSVGASGHQVTHTMTISPKTVTFSGHSGTTSFTATYNTYVDGVLTSQLDVSQEDDVWSETGDAVEDRDLNNYEFNNTGMSEATVIVTATYNGVSDSATVKIAGSINGTIISKPINGHFVPGMLKLITTMEDGKIYTTGNASLNAGLGYNRQVECHPYVLYYLNAYGGWDAFVIEGTVIKKDTITSYQTDRSYNNTTMQFETNKYANEIKTSYELNTGLLNDEESEILAKNLIGSLKVYMHNMVEGWVKPVIITDSSVTYQKYQTNQRKLSQYRINVTESQSKLRR